VTLALRSKHLRVRSIATAVALLLTSLLFAAPSKAQIHALPFATVQYEYISNVFYQQSSAAPLYRALGYSFADHLFIERAGANLLYDVGSQEFYANGEFRHFGYSQDTNLNHAEALAHGGLKWKLGYLLDGVFDYQYEHSMVPFVQYQGAQLLLQRQQLATASANLQATPEFRLETQGQINDLESPRPGLPSLSLTEGSIRERLRYAVSTGLSAALEATYLHGHFNGSEFLVAPQYDQWTTDAAFEYGSDAGMHLGASLGYTERTPKDTPSVHGITGSVDWQYPFSEQTSAQLKVNRSVNTYLTYLGSEIDTTVSLGGTWAPTRKISVIAAYQWLYAIYPQSSFGAAGTQREDHYELPTLSVKYQVLNWLSIKPYAQYETRRSNLDTYSFNNSIFGVEVELRLSGQANQPYQLSLPD
jgi:hypothetical protein